MNPRTKHGAGRHRRRLWLAGFAVFALLLVGAALALPRIVEALLIGGLETARLPEPALRITDIGWGQATIADLRLGAEGEVTADEVVAVYTPGGLLRRRIDRITLHGLQISVRLDGETDPLGSLDGPLRALIAGGEDEDGTGAPLPEIVVEDSRIALATALGTVTVPVQGTVAPQPDGRTQGTITIPSDAVDAAGLSARALAGQASFAFGAESPPTLSAQLTLADLTLADATIAAALLDLDLDGDVGAARLSIQEAADRLSLRAEADLGDLYGRPAGTARLEASAAADSVLWRLLNLPPPTSSRLDLSAALSGQRNAEDGSLTIDRAKVTLTGLTLAGTVLETITAEGAGSGSSDDFEGTARVVAVAPSVATGTIEAKDATLAANTAFTFTDSRLSLQFAEGSLLTADALTVPGILVLAGPLHLPIAAATEPALAADFGAPDGPVVDHQLILGPTKLDARLRPDSPTPVLVEAALPRLSLTGSWRKGDGYAGRANLGGGSLVLPRNQITATGVDATVTVAAGDAPVALHLTAAELAHGGDPAAFAPVGVAADGRLAGRRLDFSLRGSGADGQLSLTVAGRHDLQMGSGSAKVEVKPLVFSPGGLEPGDLAPILRGQMEEATGTAALAGSVSWTGGETDADLQLLLRDLSFVTPQATITKLNTVITLDGLSPLSTPPGQILAVAAISAGVPLTDGLVAFHIEPDMKLAIESGRLRLAGGEVSVEPVTIDLAAPANTLRLVVTDVGLSELIALAELDGLSGSGRLDGRIPVQIGDDVVIEGGVLETDAPGRLSYAPTTPPAALQAQGETVSLLLSALTNLEYQVLRLTIDRDVGGEMLVAIHLEGKNPEFYDGYPVELNFNISGKLDQVLQRSLVGYRVPDTIREKLSDFPQ